MKILVVHPGKQHSYRTATALKRGGFLYKYITTVYYRDHSFTGTLAKLAGGNLRKKIANHRIQELDENEVVVFNEFLGTALLGLAHYPKFRTQYVKLNQKLNDSFGKKVAKYALRHNVDAVISYDYNSLELFRQLKKSAPNIKRILDVSIATRPYMKQTFQKDYDMTGEDALLTKYPEIWDKNSLDRVMEEIHLSEYFFAASKVVEDSIVYCGVDRSQIYRIQYGVDCNKFDFVPKEKVHAPIKLIFVGAVNYRKGIHHLLKVVGQFRPEEVELFLAGEYDATDKLYLNSQDKENIHFLGFVTRDKLATLYQECDVFVFPTLGEGFGMVNLEAMSCGLPLIISNKAGGNDLIDEGKNGFQFEAGNDDELKDKIQWFIDHPNEIREMSFNARSTAEKYTWDEYYTKVCKAVKEIVAK